MSGWTFEESSWNCSPMFHRQAVFRGPYPTKHVHGSSKSPCMATEVSTHRCPGRCAGGPVNSRLTYEGGTTGSNKIVKPPSRLLYYCPSLGEGITKLLFRSASAAHLSESCRNPRARTFVAGQLCFLFVSPDLAFHPRRRAAQCFLSRRPNSRLPLRSTSPPTTAVNHPTPLPVLEGMEVFPVTRFPSTE